MDQGIQVYANKITKLLLERDYKKQKKILPASYWNISPYKFEYKRTLVRVISLLKCYEHEAVYQAFLKNKWIYSPGFPRMQELIEKEELKLNSKVVDQPVEVVNKDTKTFSKSSKKSNLKDKL